MGIVKPIKASWLSVWVTFHSRKQLRAEELLLNITLRTRLFLVTLQYPLLELCVLRIRALGYGASLTALAGALGARAMGADILQLSSVTPCLFKADTVAVTWTMSAMCSVNYWSSVFLWMQCPVEHCAYCASRFHQSNAITYNLKHLCQREHSIPLF